MAARPALAHVAPWFLFIAPMEQSIWLVGLSRRRPWPPTIFESARGFRYSRPWLVGLDLDPDEDLDDPAAGGGLLRLRVWQMHLPRLGNVTLRGCSGARGSSSRARAVCLCHATRGGTGTCFLLKIQTPAILPKLRSYSVSGLKEMRANVYNSRFLVLEHAYYRSVAGL